jgi:hypothetical protein
VTNSKDDSIAGKQIASSRTNAVIWQFPTQPFRRTSILLEMQTRDSRKVRNLPSEMPGARPHSPGGRRGGGETVRLVDSTPHRSCHWEKDCMIIRLQDCSLLWAENPSDIMSGSQTLGHAVRMIPMMSDRIDSYCFAHRVWIARLPHASVARTVGLRNGCSRPYSKVCAPNSRTE